MPGSLLRQGRQHMGFFSKVRNFFKSDSKPEVKPAEPELEEQAAPQEQEAHEKAAPAAQAPVEAAPEVSSLEEPASQESPTEQAPVQQPEAEAEAAAPAAPESACEPEPEPAQEQKDEAPANEVPSEAPAEEQPSEAVADAGTDEAVVETAVIEEVQTEEPAAEEPAPAAEEASQQDVKAEEGGAAPVEEAEPEAEEPESSASEPEPEAAPEAAPAAAEEEPQGAGQAEDVQPKEPEAPVPGASEEAEASAEKAQEKSSAEEAALHAAEQEAAPAAEPEGVQEQPAEPAQEEAKSGGFLAGLKRFFGGSSPEEEKGGKKDEAPAQPEAAEKAAEVTTEGAAAGKDSSDVYQQLMTRLREADSRLSVWLDIVLDGVTEAGPELNDRISFLLRSLEAPADEVETFVKDFDEWLGRMEYHYLDEFRSELQYRLSLALDLEDEEDERSRLFIKLSDSLAKTRAHFARQFDALLSSHGELNDDFWEELEEVFIMADLGVEASMELVRRLKERALAEKATTTEAVRELLRQEIRGIFVRPRRIVGVNPPEVVLMIGVNGAGKTTTIAKLAYRDQMQGKKVMIAAADTFRAAAIDQMRVWAERVGTLFHAKQPGSDPASVAYEAMDRALSEKVDVLYVDTAGRLQTKVNLMDELSKIRSVLERKHPGAPHRTVLVLDATTGQNALSQAKLFKESAGVDELILTKLDGTAKGGVAIAVAMQHKLPITYIGLGEKVEDLRPFNGDDYADALFQ